MPQGQFHGAHRSNFRAIPLSKFRCTPTTGKLDNIQDLLPILVTDSVRIAGYGRSDKLIELAFPVFLSEW